MRMPWLLLLTVTAACGGGTLATMQKEIAPGRGATVGADVPLASVAFDGPGTVIVSQGDQIRAVLGSPRPGRTSVTIPVAPLADGAQQIDISVLQVPLGEIDIGSTLNALCVRCSPQEPMKCCPWLRGSLPPRTTP